MDASAFGWSPNPWWFDMDFFTSRAFKGLLTLMLAALCAHQASHGWHAGAVFWLILTIASAMVTLTHGVWPRPDRLRVIRDYPFPEFLQQKLRTTYPHLDAAAALEVEHGLRQFFLASAQARGSFVAMPSKVVDALWHEFILYTRGYEAFCRKAFGRILHHTPAEALQLSKKKRGSASAGLRRAWYWSCQEERIDPKRAERLPLLFTLDARYAIAGGYRYAADCRGRNINGATYCAALIGCGSSCGSGGDAASRSAGSEPGNDSHADDAGSGGDGGSCGGGSD